MWERIMEKNPPILTDHMVGCTRRTHLSPLKEDETFIIHLWLHCLWIMSLAPLLLGTNLLSQQTAVVVMHFFPCLIDRCQKILFFSYLYLTNTMKCTFLWHKTRLDGYTRYIQLKSFEYPLYVFVSFRIQVLNHFLELQNLSILKYNSLIYEKLQKTYINECEIKDLTIPANQVFI